MPNERQRLLMSCAKYHEDFARGVSQRLGTKLYENHEEWCKAQRDEHLAWARACRNETVPDKGEKHDLIAIGGITLALILMSLSDNISSWVWRLPIKLVILALCITGIPWAWRKFNVK